MNVNSTFDVVFDAVPACGFSDASLVDLDAPLDRRSSTGDRVGRSSQLLVDVKAGVDVDVDVDVKDHVEVR